MNEQIIKFREENVPQCVSKELDEAAWEYAKKEMAAWGCNDETNELKEVYDDFIAGAKWQKENMLRKATEGQIENGEDYMRIKCLCMGCAPEQDGGIVKIIIVKENE